jgi:myo-inositol 2-dehydrogenase/D-chiro-inositol 1-dehydrogenase
MNPANSGPSLIGFLASRETARLGNLQRLFARKQLDWSTMIGSALLGAGRMARVHARAIAAAGARLVTVFDVVDAAAASLAAETGAVAAGSVEDALRHPEVGAVIVVTSSDTHVDCILQGVEAGRAVMCE